MKKSIRPSCVVSPLEAILAGRLGCGKQEARDIVLPFVKSLRGLIAKNDKVEIPGVGIFRVIPDKFYNCKIGVKTHRIATQQKIYFEEYRQLIKRLFVETKRLTVSQSERPSELIQNNESESEKEGSDHNTRYNYHGCPLRIKVVCRRNQQAC